MTADRPKHTILLLDAHEGWCQWMSARLQDFGLEVVAVESARDAYDRLVVGGFDAFVFDAQTPQMGGVRFLRGIRAKGLDVPAIVLSAVLSDQQRLEFARLGVFGSFEKPVRLSQVLASVQKALDFGYRLRVLQEQIRGLENATADAERERREMLRSQLALLRVQQQEAANSTLSAIQAR
jgi:DNA-binding NtrC family response regulator